MLSRVWLEPARYSRCFVFILNMVVIVVVVIVVVYTSFLSLLVEVNVPLIQCPR